MGLLFFFQSTSSQPTRAAQRTQGFFFPGKLLVSCQPLERKLLPQSRRWQQSGVQHAPLRLYSLSSFLAFGKSKDEIRFRQLI